MSVTLRVQRLPHGEGLPLPSYQSKQAAGLDVVAGVPEGAPVALPPGARALVPTGFALELPRGYEAQVRPRSGLALKHGVTLLNSPGTIDSDYRGELMVMLVNHGDEPFLVRRGERIAQLVIAAGVSCRDRRGRGACRYVRGRAASARPAERADLVMPGRERASSTGTSRLKLGRGDWVARSSRAMTRLQRMAYIAYHAHPDEIERYKRQLVLKEIGGEGQQKLKASRVLVVGAGGLGSPLMLYLAAAGVGEIGIIDSDRVSLDNLHRQIVHDTESVGRPKTKSAARAIERLNPHVATRLYSTRLVPENALAIIGGYDIVADGSDNFATRYLVNDACYFAKKPLVFAAVGPFDGHVTTFRAFETDETGNHARPIAASSPSRRRKARSRLARRPAFSGRSRASSALLPRSKWSRSCFRSAKASSAGCSSMMRSRRG